MMNRTEIEKRIRKHMVWTPLVIYFIMLCAYLIIGLAIYSNEDYATISCVLLCSVHIVYASADLLFMAYSTKDGPSLTDLTTHLLEDRSSDNHNPERNKWHRIRFLFIIGSLLLYIIAVLIIGRTTDRNKVWWALISPYDAHTLFQPLLSAILIIGCLLSRYFQFNRMIKHHSDDLAELRGEESEFGTQSGSSESIFTV